jgi:bifunctional UDP-N-acetylglucosamine pyrophosphorylase/glucosamine-1-phosphate N-acetyltransferase
MNKYIECCRRHTLNGVIIIDENSTYIDDRVLIESGVTIYPNNFITGDTFIKKNVVLYPNNVIKDSFIDEECFVGPFSNLKGNNEIGKKCVIGAFVELKNAKLKDNVRAKHHAYLGDVEIGENCNIGCGVIIANYDGKTKQKSVIENDVFVGSNVTIISPVHIGNNSLIAAGSTIVENVDSNSLAIARKRQINKKGYYKSL